MSYNCSRQCVAASSFILTRTAVEDSRRPALYASAATSTARPTTTFYAVYGEPARDFFHARREYVVYGKGVVRFGGGKKQ